MIHLDLEKEKLVNMLTLSHLTMDIYAFDHDNISYKKVFLAALAIMRNVYINVFLDAYRDWLFSNGFLYQYLAYILETTTLKLIQKMTIYYPSKLEIYIYHNGDLILLKYHFAWYMILLPKYFETYFDPKTYNVIIFWLSL